jgi:hypothetical protein
MGGVTGPVMYSIEEGGRMLASRIRSGIPFVAGKLGTSELDALLWFKSHGDGVFPIHIQKNMRINAGVFGSETCIKEWCIYMLEHLGMMDEIALWNPLLPAQERYFVAEHCASIQKFLPLRALEPFYQKETDNRWSLAISSFCVVSSFADSIESQWPKRDFLFPYPLFGAAEFKGCVRVGYSPLICKGDESCSWPLVNIEGGWFSAVTSVVEECVRRDISFVFVGAGALSLPICFELKKRGISAIHTGGGTQIIFGVRGRRWIAHSVISQFFNAAWTSPLAKEIPSGAERIEGGCYF